MAGPEREKTMKAKAERLVAGAVVLLSCWGSLLYAEAYQLAGGSGEPNDPYQIATAEQLTSIGSDPNLLDKHFVLLNDIDLDPNLPGGRTFTTAVIAPSSDTYCLKGVPFAGSLDGRGYILRNLTFKEGPMGFLGLFGNVAKGAVVSDLKVENAKLHQGVGWLRRFTSVLVAWNEGRIVRCSVTGTVTGSESAGILAGFNRGEIIDCWAQGEVAADGMVGGLVGFNSYGTIVNSHAACRVSTTGLSESGGPYGNGGGLVGTSRCGVIVNCWAAGDVSGMPDSFGLGGLVGSADRTLIAHSYATGNVCVGSGGFCLGGLVGDGDTIYDCYATGNVSGGDRSKRLGGLVGDAQFISDSYAIGRVSVGPGSENIGGLVGGIGATRPETNGCFWNVETSGLATSAGGVGLSTIRMQDAATYLVAGWDLAGERENGTADSWFIPEGGGYPSLTFHSAAFEPHKLNGAGTPEDPYRIATREDLEAVSNYDPTACYRLEADIDLAQSTRDRAIVRYFDGKFDGGNRVVTGLTIRGGGYLGLFGNLGERASVTNLGIHDVNITGRHHLGALAATSRARITACRADGTITGHDTMGILAGCNEGSTSDSYGTGSVLSLGVSWYDGGLTGVNTGIINRCYTVTRVHFLSPDVTPNEFAGWPAGLNAEPGDSMVAFAKCLADKSVSGEIHNSYLGISSQEAVRMYRPGCGTELSDMQMKQQASFPGWDFDATWTICEGKDYPRLRWEDAHCEQ
jgi:hypothetical protein